MSEVQHHDTVLYKLLDSTSLKEVRGIKDQNVVIIQSHTELKYAFQSLIDNHISCAPVFDSKQNKFVGLLDVKDFVAFILWLYGKSKSIVLAEIPVMSQEITNICKANPFVPVLEDASLGHVLKEFCDRQLHRMPVLSKVDKSKVIAMVSQSTVIQWLSENKEKLGKMVKKSILELSTGTIGNLQSVSKVPKETMLLDVYKMLFENHIHGCAVIGENHSLVGNVSVSDLQFSVDENIDYMSLPVWNFVQRFLKHPMVTCKSSDSLEDVIDSLAQNNLHRIYVTNDKNQPIGVVTSTDIMNSILLLSTGIEPKNAK